MVADQLPNTPALKLGDCALSAGRLSGAAVAIAGGQTLLGAIGAVGRVSRPERLPATEQTGLVRALKVRDIVIALLEDAIAIGGGLFLRFQLRPP